MHIPDGFISTQVSATTFGVALVYGIIAHRKIIDFFEGDETRIPMVAAVSAFVFAAQMLNFPVLAGTSGHFLGAGLTTALFGPWVSFLIFSLVVLIQSLFFGDGGVLAIGANILVMGIVAPWAFQLIVPNVYKSFSISSSFKIGIASWISILAASLFCTFLVSLSQVVSFHKMALVMVLIHALIGVGEAFITLSALRYIGKSKSFNVMKYEK